MLAGWNPETNSRPPATEQVLQEGGVGNEHPDNWARSLPKKAWKSVTDVLKGYHSVPLHKEDRHLTTFITPWG